MKPLPLLGAVSLNFPATAEPAPLRAQLRAAGIAAPRRVNRLIELALLGAHRCAGGRQLPAQSALFLGVTSGCIDDAAKLVRAVAANKPPTPISFINVSSNMAGYYTAASLGLQGENQVVAHAEFPWEATLQLAIISGQAPLLIGAAEECVWPLDQHRLRMALPAGQALLESSHWLCADPESTDASTLLRACRTFTDDSQLTSWLQDNPLPSHTRLSLAGTTAELPAVVASLPRWRDTAPAGFSGLRAASQCCEFVASGQTGSLLHLSRGNSGGWAALLIEAGCGG